MKAVLLCAGFGTRLGPLTENCPKPLLEVGGKPIVLWQILNLKKVGVSHFYINLHYLGDKIEKYLGDGGQWDVSIQYFWEEKPSGTAGGVKVFESQLKNEEEFFILYGDIVTNQDFAELLNFHRRSSAGMSFHVHNRKNSNSLFRLNESGRVEDYLERPSEEEKNRFISEHSIENYWVNSAIYVTGGGFFDHFPESEIVDIPKDIFAHFVQQKSLYALPISGQRFAIDSKERLELANREFNGDLI